MIVVWCRPRLGDHFFGAVERLGTRLARKKRLAIFLMGIAPVVLRLSLLWFLPIPVPQVHDEFSYLLAADTFAHGRLANPPHPLWIFFDTIHVNQHPTYMSKYPPAQGALLAFGQLLGNPWFGVILGIGVMCAAILWMLQSWLPPRWALLGATLVLLRVGIFGYWMNSYWGGALAAIGGALAVGALPRIMHHGRARDALILAIGAAILANTRPLEGLVLCLPVLAVLFAWLCRKSSPPLRVTLPRLILPFFAVMLLCGTFMAYYNWRGTGNALVFPYQVNERTYLSTPVLLWQRARPPLHYQNAQFETFYNVWSRQFWLEGQVHSFRQAVRHTLQSLWTLVYFFLWLELCVPFLVLPWMVRDRRVRFLIVLTIIFFLGFLLNSWGTQPHYAAPLTATLFALLTQAIRHLRQWQPGGRPIGIGLSRLVVLFALLSAPFHGYPLHYTLHSAIEQRAQFERQLDSIPGNQLVIVRYSPSRKTVQEWVYNEADIDHAKIVWAREIPGMDIQPLLDYFHGRRVWLVEPDASPPRMSPYPAAPL